MGLDLVVSRDTEKILKRIVKLQPEEFIGVCKILGVKFYTQEVVVDAAGSCCTDNNEDEVKDTTDGRTDTFKVVVRPAEDIIPNMVEAIEQLSRTQRRNLDKLLKPATKGR